MSEMRNTELIGLSLVAESISYESICKALGEDATRLILKGLENRDLVKGPPTAKSAEKWSLTAKGASFILMILKTPEPINVWHDPRELR